MSLFFVFYQKKALENMKNLLFHIKSFFRSQDFHFFGTLFLLLRLSSFKVEVEKWNNFDIITCLP